MAQLSEKIDRRVVFTDKFESNLRDELDLANLNESKSSDTKKKWFGKKKTSKKSNVYRYAMCVSVGTFSPIHRMHIDNLEMAKSAIENGDHGYTRVIGAFISPTHDDASSPQIISISLHAPS